MRILPALLLLFAVACDDEPAARPDDAPYYTPCTRAPDSCPAPYVCTSTQPSHQPDAGVVDVCLMPCDSSYACPANCCCKGIDCGADVGEDGFCVCV
jgi:hypothetical protein